MRRDELCLLSLDLLDRHPKLAAELRALSHALDVPLGWHYILDLIWVAVHLGAVSGTSILDAGAGWGLLQWLLAERGARVVSVDREPRRQVADRFRLRYRVTGLAEDDVGEVSVRRAWSDARPHGLSVAVYRAARRAARQALNSLRPRAAGQVLFHRAQLDSLDAVPTGAVDFVVSISALEHNPRESLAGIVDELMRVLKPGGCPLATLSATDGHDFFHQPSMGWCLTETTLREAFGLGPDVKSSFDRFSALFSELVACAELPDNLAAFSSQSGQNGMPWGVWDPQYHPVGIVKGKSA